MLRVLLSLFLLSAFASSSAAQTHFHHVHLNSTDPRAAIEFYTTHLSGERAIFDGADAVWTQASWLLFNKVKQPPPSKVVRKRRLARGLRASAEAGLTSVHDAGISIDTVASESP